MRSYKCLIKWCEAHVGFSTEYEFTKCPICGSRKLKRLWTTSLNAGKHGYKNNFGGNK